MRKLILFLFISFAFIISCSSTKNNTALDDYKPDDPELYKTIVRLDSIFFDGYNTCKVDIIEKYFSEDLEFYHDNGGLNTSKKQIIESFKNNICGKITRILIPGSIEVYPIANYGAIEIAKHKFFNNREPNAKQKIGKTVMIWKKENDSWKITRVISLH